MVRDMSQDVPPIFPAVTNPVVVAMPTFLMTDIEGSTRLWEEHPESMAVVLQTHDATLRAAVEERGGTVIKTTGDGLLAHFADPIAAVHGAIDGQGRLASMACGPGVPVRVRMALHTGTAQARDGDYFGPALNRVARLLAIGHGGQVLVSGVTAALVGDRLGPDVGLLDRGDHVLRDLAQPERVHQVVAPGLARDFPALRSDAASQSTLPIQLSSFVGRERDLEDVRRLSEMHRLVTLIGTGGTGKTRLMLEAAPTIESRFKDGTRLAELAPISDPDLVVREVARAVGAREQPGSPPIETLGDFLRFKTMLLLLDNCEHVIGAVADLAHRLLTSCPGVTILATSREALGIPGETIFQVPSLGLPRSDARTDPHDLAAADRFDEIASAGAVRLFVDRAAAAVPDFALTTDNASTIAEICARLDGIPLAIELAAARVTVLSVDDILRRLGDRFRLLTGGRRTAVPRQQTLQALIDWSWDLLAEPDRRVLRRLSVFAGGWTLDAASAVCAEPSEDATEFLDALERLVERSLANVDRSMNTRYRLLETIRQYARERLTENGEVEAIRGRHLAFFLDLAERAEHEMRGPSMIEWLARIDADADNIRAAIEWGLEADPETAGRLCSAVWLHWRVRSSGAESAAWLTQAVERMRLLSPLTDADCARARAILFARLLAQAAFAKAVLTNEPTVAWAEEGLALARTTDDPDAISEALGAVWGTRFFSGSTTGLRALAEEAIALAEQRQDWWGLSMAEASLANSIRIEDPASVPALLASAAEHARMTGNPFVTAFTNLTRGRVLGVTGNIGEARAAFDEAFAAYTELGDDRFALVARSDLGHALRAAGELDEAEAVYRGTIHGWAHLGNRGAISNQLESFAFLAVRRGQLERAARLLGAAEALRDASGATMVPYERAEYEAVTADLRTRLDGSTLKSEWASGRSMDMLAAADLAVR